MGLRSAEHCQHTLCRGLVSQDQNLTFTDAIAAGRLALWLGDIYRHSPQNHEKHKIPPTVSCVWLKPSASLHNVQSRAKVQSAFKINWVVMSFYFEELDYRPTPIGNLSLRRRRELSLGIDIFEIKLGEEFLMSSLFTASEVALAHLGLGELDKPEVNVLVGGLGLGYTAQAVLEHSVVTDLVVVEALEPVIDWHQQGVVPLGPELTADPRCRFHHGDFFALATSDQGLVELSPERPFDAILVDIDHSPEVLLDPQNANFYGPEGLQRFAAQLSPGGVFGLWSNEPPDAAFTERLASVFALARAEPVTFNNPLQRKDFTQCVYLARTKTT